MGAVGLLFERPAEADGWDFDSFESQDVTLKGVSRMLNGFLLRGCSVFGVLQDRGPKDEYDHDACSAFHFGTSQDAAVIPDRRCS